MFRWAQSLKINNWITFETGPHFYMSILFKQIRVEGYLCPIELMKKWRNALEDMIGWIKEVISEEKMLL